MPPVNQYHRAKFKADYNFEGMLFLEDEEFEVVKPLDNEMTFYTIAVKIWTGRPARLEVRELQIPKYLLTITHSY